MISLLPPSSSFALKEWATACLLLKEGRQIMIIRKGGIDKEDKNFTSELSVDSEFLLFPTYEHQNESELLVRIFLLLLLAVAMTQNDLHP